MQDPSHHRQSLGSKGSSVCGLHPCAALQLANRRTAQSLEQMDQNTGPTPQKGVQGARGFVSRQTELTTEVMPKLGMLGTDNPKLPMQPVGSSLEGEASTSQQQS